MVKGPQRRQCTCKMLPSGGEAEAECTGGCPPIPDRFQKPNPQCPRPVLVTPNDPGVCPYIVCSHTQSGNLVLLNTLLFRHPACMSTPAWNSKGVSFGGHSRTNTPFFQFLLESTMTATLASFISRGGLCFQQMRPINLFLKFPPKTSLCHSPGLLNPSRYKRSATQNIILVIFWSELNDSYGNDGIRHPTCQVDIVLD